MAESFSYTDTTPSARGAAPRLLTLPEQIAENISFDILAGKFKPGDPIREQELAERFQVSRGPIREALRILEKGAVVRIVPQRGAHVTLLTAKEVNELFEIRGALVKLLARELVPADSDLLHDLEGPVASLEKLAHRPDSAEEFTLTSYRLSQRLFRSSTNEKLVELLRSLANQTSRYTRLGLSKPERRIESSINWRALLEHMRAGNGDGVAAALEKLINSSRLAALKALETTESD
jgi:DNA-binding GntR family transcriptional regulator